MCEASVLDEMKPQIRLEMCQLHSVTSSCLCGGSFQTKGLFQPDIPAVAVRQRKIPAYKYYLTTCTYFGQVLTCR